MRALLPLVMLLLAACDLAVTETSSRSLGAAQSTTHNGGGSSGSGGSSGGGSPPSSPSPPAVVPVNPSGIWDIKDTVNGNPITEVALIAGGKYYSLATADRFGCADITGGTYTVDGAMFTGSGLTVLLNDCTGPNNQQGYQPYTLSGYMTDGYLNLTFGIGGVGVPTLGATMDPLYNEPSSLAKLTGNWDDAGNTLTVNPDGTFFEQTASGCVVNGVYTIIDPTHNLYGVSFEITNCSSSRAGIVFTGLGYLDDSNPAWHFIEDVSGPDPANGGAIVLASDNITPNN